MSGTSNKNLIHCIAFCENCNLEWTYYITARKEAYKHAKKTGHKVTGETGYTFEYHYPKACKD